MKATHTLVMVACLALALPVGAQQMYQWKDTSGKLHFSDKPPDDAKAGDVKVEQARVYESPAKANNWAGVIRQPVKGDNSPAAGSGGPLTMYATSWCGYCRKARAYLAARQIPYREVDIEASPANQAEFRKYGGRGVPFFTAGERTMRGFSEAGMDRFLAATR